MPRIVKVKVHPKARLNKVQPDDEGGYTIWTTAPPDKGAANDAVIRALAEHLDMPRRLLSLVSGAASRQKLIKIDEA